LLLALLRLLLLLDLLGVLAGGLARLLPGGGLPLSLLPLLLLSLLLARAGYLTRGVLAGGILHVILLGSSKEKTPAWGVET
jgi:hypothetical protein